MVIIVAILATLGALAAWTLNWELSAFLFFMTTSILVWKAIKKTHKVDETEMNLSQIVDSMKSWCPGFLIVLFVVLVCPIRVLILICLPPDSRYEWHPLHKIQDFWGFYK